MTAAIAQIAVLAPMVPELEPVVAALALRPDGGDEQRHLGEFAGVQVRAYLTGIGMQPARDVTARALAEGPVDRVIVVGIAGGVDPSLDIGHVIDPEVVIDRHTGTAYRPVSLTGAPPFGALVTGDELTHDLSVLTSVAHEPVLAVDMETAAVGEVCEARGFPWSVIRAISDQVGDPAIDQSTLDLAGADGKGDPDAVRRYLKEHPERLADFKRLGDQMVLATTAVADTLVRALQSWA